MTIPKSRTNTEESGRRLRLVHGSEDGVTGTNDDETNLVRAAVGGSVDAFTQLLRRYDDQMRALAFSMTGAATAMDDVLQNAYLKAFRSIGSFKSQSSFKTWLWRIVFNSAMDEARHSKSSAHIVEIESVVETAVNEDVSLRLDIDAALQRLSPEHRAVVLLIDGEGFDYQSAADLLDIPAGTVSSRINHARKALRELLALSIEDGLK